MSIYTQLLEILKNKSILHISIEPLKDHLDKPDNDEESFTRILALIVLDILSNKNNSGSDAIVSSIELLPPILDSFSHDNNFWQNGFESFLGGNEKPATDELPLTTLFRKWKLYSAEERLKRSKTWVTLTAPVFTQSATLVSPMRAFPEDSSSAHAQLFVPAGAPAFTPGPRAKRKLEFHGPAANKLSNGTEEKKEENHSVNNAQKKHKERGKNFTVTFEEQVRSLALQEGSLDLSLDLPSTATHSAASKQAPLPVNVFKNLELNEKNIENIAIGKETFITLEIKSQLKELTELLALVASSREEEGTEGNKKLNAWIKKMDDDLTAIEEIIEEETLPQQNDYLDKILSLLDSFLAKIQKSAMYQAAKIFLKDVLLDSPPHKLLLNLYYCHFLLNETYTEYYTVIKQMDLLVQLGFFHNRLQSIPDEAKEAATAEEIESQEDFSSQHAVNFLEDWVNGYFLQAVSQPLAKESMDLLNNLINIETVQNTHQHLRSVFNDARDVNGMIAKNIRDFSVYYDNAISETLQQIGGQDYLKNLLNQIITEMPANKLLPHLLYFLFALKNLDTHVQSERETLQSIENSVSTNSELKNVVAQYTKNAFPVQQPTLLPQNSNA